MSISNTKETSVEVMIEVELSKPFYIYQQKFDHVLGDGTTLSAWGGGYVISPKPLT